MIWLILFYAIFAQKNLFRNAVGSNKHIFFTVTNSLNTDQRMQRICRALTANGYQVTLVGWELFTSPELISQPFNQHRIRIYFQSGKLRYIEYNLKLMWYLLKQPLDCIGAIDLDTIFPCYLISKIRNKRITYDAHEYFTELEEIVRRPIVHKIWQWVERITVPKIKFGYAVNDSYVRLFKEKYQVEYAVVRNATVLASYEPMAKSERFILYQGAVNEGRALTQLLEAMQQVDCKLIICGSGDVLPNLKALTKQLHLANKVEFMGQVPPAQLVEITRKATIGITLFENNGLSNYYSLANRYFDYMHASVPQLCCKFPEYAAINTQYEIAHLINDVQPANIAAALNKLLSDSNYLNRLSENCTKAKQEYNWQNEEKKLLQVYAKLWQ